MSASGQYAFASVNGGNIYYSSNYGSSWTVNTSSPSNWSNTASWGCITMSANGEITYAAVNGGYIYSSTVTKNMMGNLITTGTITGSVKNFMIDHPINQTKYLMHSCLEGPEMGVYYRGKDSIINNTSVAITLPEYVSVLAFDFTIQITPIYDGTPKTVYQVSEIVENQFTVYGDNGSFYWIVYGKRGDIIVEPDK